MELEFSWTKPAPMRHKVALWLKDSSGSLTVGRRAYNGLACYSRDASLLGFPLSRLGLRLSRFALCRGIRDQARLRSRSGQRRPAITPSLPCDEVHVA